MKAWFGSTEVEVWRNVDDGEPIPSWMTEVACRLDGGRFAVETRVGTLIANPSDWIVYSGGTAYVFRAHVFEMIYHKTQRNFS